MNLVLKGSYDTTAAGIVRRMLTDFGLEDSFSLRFITSSNIKPPGKDSVEFVRPHGARCVEILIFSKQGYRNRCFLNYTEEAASHANLFDNLVAKSQGKRKFEPEDEKLRSVPDFVSNALDDIRTCMGRQWFTHDLVWELVFSTYESAEKGRAIALVEELFGRGFLEKEVSDVATEYRLKTSSSDPV